MKTESFMSSTTRRAFLKTTAKAAALTALAATPRAGYTAENNTIKVALIGCGGRGTGAAANALSTKSGPIKLVAMADVFENKLTRSVQGLKKFGEQFDVPEERQFLGFDAYKKAMDCLGKGDVAIFATPPAFRWVHFQYAIEKGLNVFMEKPVTVDGPTSKRMLALAEESVKKGMKVGVGLMCRHCRARAELFKRIKDGEIGEIIMLRAYRMHGPGGNAGPKTSPEQTELMYQIQKFHSFLWASGGIYSDYLIHNIDECCWMKDAWPVSAQGLGARHYRGNSVDQNFDIYSVEYTFADGTKLFLDGRYINGCHNEFASYAHGTKNCAVISTAAHTPSRARIYQGQIIGRSGAPAARGKFDENQHAPEAKQLWAAAQPEPNPYQMEWDDLISAIREDKPYNEVKRGVEASVVTAMGRMAAHTGRMVTYEQMLNHPHELAPQVAQFTPDHPAPVQAGPDGKYPVPQPGIVTDREY